MLEGKGMIHERRMQIRLRRMARVARFGEETEIGKLQAADQITITGKRRQVLSMQTSSVGKDGKKNHHRYNQEKDCGGAAASWHIGLID